MPFPIIKISDMLGPVMIQQNDETEVIFDLERDAQVNTFLRQVLGVTLANLLIAEVEANATEGKPTTARMLAIFNPFQEDHGNKVIESKGMKEMLKELVWYYFARSNNSLVTMAGNKQPAGENSTPTSDNFYLVRIFNQAVDTGKAIQWYIYQHLEDYEEFNGQELRYAIGL